MSIITKGIILAGDSGDKLYPLTMGVPKQLLPIYDKPMIFYPIKTLVEVGITDILIITSPQYISAFIQALGDGSKCHSVEGKPSSPQHYSITGLYVFPKGVADYVKVLDKSERGRYEVTSLNQAYLAANKLQVQKFGEDILWFDTNTFNSLLRVSNYMQSKDKKRL